MALEYAAWIYNHVPHQDNGLAPMERFTGTKMDCTYLRRVRVWGCPSYVLDPKLQDGHKLPKWAARSRQGQFLGFSSQHSTTIGMIRNLATGTISPQYHVVYDELFHTVTTDWQPPDDNDTTWPDIFIRDHYLEEYDPTVDGPLPAVDPSWTGPPSNTRHNPTANHPPAPSPSPLGVIEGETTSALPLDTDNTMPVLPNEDHTPFCQPNFQPDFLNPDTNIDPRIPDELDSRHTDFDKQGERTTEKQGKRTREKQGERTREKQGEAIRQSEESTNNPSGRPIRERRAPRRFPDPDKTVRWNLPTEESAWEGHHSQQRYLLGRELRNEDNHGISYEATHNINRSPSAFARAANSVNWDSKKGIDVGSIASILNRPLEQHFVSTGFIEDWDPRFFSAQLIDTDTPSYFDLRKLNEAERRKWREAMDTELNELESRNTFRMVPRHIARGKEIVDCMWTLRKKRLPDGTISRYKARLVVRGDQQKAEINRENTFAPVTDWATVRLLLTLSLQFDLTTVSIDFKNAFVQSDLPEPIYLEMPQGYGEGHADKVLEVTKSLYGDCLAP
ncbi:hypothetical protein ACA910_018971 [Epithemia clementina (nom. ined.)]